VESGPYLPALMRLTRPAQIAFAVRCAERVQPLVGYLEYLSTGTEVVQLSRVGRFALGRAIQAAKSAMPIHPEQAQALSDQYRCIAPHFEKDVFQPAEVGVAAVAAAIAAMNAAAADSDGPQAAMAASRHALRAAAAFDTEQASAPIVACYAHDSTLHAMKLDLSLLAAMQEMECWRGHSKIDPNLCGTLWPEGRPNGWPEDPPDTNTYPLRLWFTVPSASNDAATDAAVQEILESANALHLALGGSGLRIVDSKAYEPSRALAPSNPGGGA